MVSFSVVFLFILLRGFFMRSLAFSLIFSFSAYICTTTTACFNNPNNRCPELGDIVTTTACLLLIYIAAQKKWVVYYFKMWLFYIYVATTCLFYLPYLFINPFKVNNLRWILLFWKKTLPIFGLTVEVINREKLETDEPCVIVCNHQSSLDFIATVNVMQPRTTILAKKELLYSGPFGLAAWLAGLIFVDRSNHKSAMDTMKYVSSIVKERKAKVWIFPEGTRNMNGSILPFKKGAFHLAIEAQVPIIPVVFSSYKGFIDHDNLLFENGHIKVTCLSPIPTVGLTTSDMDDLMAQVHGLMSNAFDESSSHE